MSIKSSNIQWIDKYKPTNFDDITINKDQLILINNWLINFNDKDTHGTIIVSGNHGVGKNTSIELLLKKLNFIPNILSSNCLKNKKSINEILKICKKNHNVYDMLINNCDDKKHVLIIDDAETITLTGEKTTLSDLCKLNDTAKILPIIFILNGQSAKYISELKKTYREYHLDVPTSNDLMRIFNVIVQNEKLKITNKKIIDSIIKYSQFDIRRFINLLQDLFMTYGNDDIDVDKLQKFFCNSQKKKLDAALCDSTRELLVNYKNINHCMDLFESQKVCLPLTVYENFYKCIFSRTTNEKNKHKLLINQLDVARRISDSVSKGDVIETNIYADQNWMYQDIHGFFAICDSSYHLNKILKNEKQDTFKIDYSTDLNKTSLKHINKKNIAKINAAIPDKTYEDILYINKLLCKLVINDQIKTAYKLCKKYPIDIKMLEIITKIDKTTGKIKITPKIKKLFVD